VLKRAAVDTGLANPTPVQAVAIPAVLLGHDVWVTAPPGFAT
jgi:superfamily II DNA/RNA helicase